MTTYINNPVSVFQTRDEKCLNILLSVDTAVNHSFDHASVKLAEARDQLANVRLHFPIEPVYHKTEALAFIKKMYDLFVKLVDLSSVHQSLAVRLDDMIANFPEIPLENITVYGIVNM